MNSNQAIPKLQVFIRIDDLCSAPIDQTTSVPSLISPLPTTEQLAPVQEHALKLLSRNGLIRRSLQKLFNMETFALNSWIVARIRSDASKILLAWIRRAPKNNILCNVAAVWRFVSMNYTRFRRSSCAPELPAMVVFSLFRAVWGESVYLHRLIVR